MTWDDPKKKLQYACPSSYCKVKGKRGELCPIHKKPLVLYYGYERSSKYWILKRKPLNRSLSKKLGLV